MANRGSFLIKPESQALVEHYKKILPVVSNCCDALSIKRFSQDCKKQLLLLLKDAKSTELVEFVARFGNYSDHEDHASMRKAVSRLLKKDGIRLPRGKRTKPGLAKLVGDLTPLLLFLGLPGASSERSRLVQALRLIAEEFGIEGDPRDELRRLNEVENKIQRNTERILNEVFSRAFAQAFAQGNEHKNK